jgi:hypothetical protein
MYLTAAAALGLHAGSSTAYKSSNKIKAEGRRRVNSKGRRRAARGRWRVG